VGGAGGVLIRRGGRTSGIVSLEDQDEQGARNQEVRTRGREWAGNTTLARPGNVQRVAGETARRESTKTHGANKIGSLAVIQKNEGTNVQRVSLPRKDRETGGQKLLSCTGATNLSGVWGEFEVRRRFSRDGLGLTIVHQTWGKMSERVGGKKILLERIRHRPHKKDT